MKPATPKARVLLAKLEALAERGINGEKAAAEKKLERLRARYDFTAPVADYNDLFKGNFQRSIYAKPILTVPDCDIANSIKWAIEAQTGIACVYQGGELAAQAELNTAKTLAGIAGTISESFAALWKRFFEGGALPADRRCFFMGLYDGMMNETRTGLLPARAVPPVKVAKAKRGALMAAPALAVHPYSVAVNLGRQIRFCVPLDEITNELDNALTKHLTN